MKKLYCLLALLLLAALFLSAAALTDEDDLILATEVPDDAFRAVLTEYMGLDPDGDGVITAAECAAVQELWLGNGAYNITSLEGIEHFPNLLRIFGGMYLNNLTTLDLSQNTKVQNVAITNSGLTTVNMRGCTNLYSLQLSYNQITSINLTGARIVSKAKAKYESELATLNDLMKKRDEIRNKQLMEAIASSNHSFDDILEYIKSGSTQE